MSQKTNIVLNQEASDLATLVGLTIQEADEVQIIINEVINAEVKRSSEEGEDGPGFNLANVVTAFNERLTVPQFVLMSAFLTSELLHGNRHKTVAFEDVEALIASMKEHGVEATIAAENAVSSLGEGAPQAQA
jgi:hypothetical protein